MFLRLSGYLVSVRPRPFLKELALTTHSLGILPWLLDMNSLFLALLVNDLKALFFFQNSRL